MILIYELSVWELVLCFLSSAYLLHYVVLFSISIYMDDIKLKEEQIGFI